MFGSEDKKVALITGASYINGLGANTARALQATGQWQVVITGRNQDSLQATATKIGCSCLVGDIANPESCNRIVAQTLDRHGKLNVLVNNAGALSPQTFFELTPLEIASMVAANLTGHMFMTHAAFNQAKSTLQHVLCVGSTAGYYAPRNGDDVPYVTAKTGLHAFLKAIKFSLHEIGCLTTLVMAGKMDTSLVKHLTGNKMSPQWAGAMVAQIISTPSTLTRDENGYAFIDMVAAYRESNTQA